MCTSTAMSSIQILISKVTRVSFYQSYQDCI
jgi:hypothetical protein